MKKAITKNCSEDDIFIHRDAKRIQDLLNYIEENMSEGITLSILADQLNVSKATVAQLFKKQVDMTFHQYLDQRRMEIAGELILTEVLLVEISKKLGYQNYYSFFHAFRKYFGISPQRYRDSGKAEQQRNISIHKYG